MSESTLSDTHTPTAHPAHRTRIPLVWIVPILAAVIGGYLGIHAILDHGPRITVSFMDGEGIEAGKTKVRYKSVDIGDVKTVTLEPDGRKICGAFPAFR